MLPALADCIFPDATDSIKDQLLTGAAIEEANIAVECVNSDIIQCEECENLQVDKLYTKQRGSSHNKRQAKSRDDRSRGRSYQQRGARPRSHGVSQPKSESIQSNVDVVANRVIQSKVSKVVGIERKYATIAEEKGEEGTTIGQRYGLGARRRNCGGIRYFAHGQRNT